MVNLRKWRLHLWEQRLMLLPLQIFVVQQGMLQSMIDATPIIMLLGTLTKTSIWQGTLYCAAFANWGRLYFLSLQ